MHIILALFLLGFAATAVISVAILLVRMCAWLLDEHPAALILIIAFAIAMAALYSGGYFQLWGVPR